MMAPFRRLASKLFPNSQIPFEGSEKLTSLSQILFYRRRLLERCHPGAFTLNPNIVRTVRKLERLVDRHMEGASAQRISMPSLSPAELWRKTGRWDDMGKELFTMSDRSGNDLCLAPTHEEVICSMVASHALSYKHLPLRLYQITNKFRDEPHPKHALLRGREFIMKDLYTFDVDEAHAMETYDRIIESYDNLFKELSLEVIKVDADTGSIGGSKSHEYHLQSDIGEDLLNICDVCGAAVNSELQRATAHTPECCSVPGEDCSSKFKSVKGIELAHAFLLGDKYSKPLNVTYRNKQNKPTLTYMGCYGIGITRLVAAAIEVLSPEDQLILPAVIAPYSLVLIPQKKGYRSEETFNIASDLYDVIDPILGGDVVLDDRLEMSIGRRVREAKLQGYPLAICLGKKSLADPGSTTEPLVELMDLYSGTSEMLPINSVKSAVLDRVKIPTLHAL